MRLMAGRAIRTTARIVFFVCGVTSLFTCFPYLLLRGSELPVQSEWVMFAVALAVVGLFSLAVSVLPRSWIAALCKQGRDDGRLFSAPLKLAGAFAAVFYLVAVVAYLAPHNWNLNSQLMLALCPMYFLRTAFDPEPMLVFFLLAPMNAGVYAALGVTLGFVRLAFHPRRKLGSGTV